jgi:hypothetical protein
VFDVRHSPFTFGSRTLKRALYELRDLCVERRLQPPRKQRTGTPPNRLESRTLEHEPETEHEPRREKREV